MNLDYVKSFNFDGNSYKNNDVYIPVLAKKYYGYIIDPVWFDSQSNNLMKLVYKTKLESRKDFIRRNYLIKAIINSNKPRNSKLLDKNKYIQITSLSSIRNILGKARYYNINPEVNDCFYLIIPNSKDYYRVQRDENNKEIFDKLFDLIVKDTIKTVIQLFLDKYICNRYNFKLYREFKIPKKDGSLRIIREPNGIIKKHLREFSRILNVKFMKYCVSTSLTYKGLFSDLSLDDEIIRINIEKALRLFSLNKFGIDKFKKIVKKENISDPEAYLKKTIKESSEILIRRNKKISRERKEMISYSRDFIDAHKNAFIRKICQILFKRSGLSRRIKNSKSRQSISYVFKDLFLLNSPNSIVLTAYNSESIKRNALIHKDSEAIIKLDLSNYFPSIKYHNFRYYLCKLTEVSVNYLDDIRSLFCDENDRLYMGNPMSGVLANMSMINVMQRMKKELIPKGILFSMYSDDLTFSNLMNPFYQRIIRNGEISEKRHFSIGYLSARFKFITEFRNINIELNNSKAGSYRACDSVITGIKIVDGTNNFRKITISDEFKESLKDTIVEYNKNKDNSFIKEKLLGKLMFYKDIDFCEFESRYKNLYLELSLKGETFF